MDTTFISPENNKTSDSHRLLLILSNEINLKRSNKYVALGNISVYYIWKNIKKLSSNNKSKMSAQHGTKDLNYLAYHILYQIFKIISTISLKNVKT